MTRPVSKPHAISHQISKPTAFNQAKLAKIAQVLA